MAAKKRKPRAAPAQIKVGCVQHDCAACVSLRKRLAIASNCLKNAEPLIRGWDPGPVSVAHKNIAEAMGALNVPLEQPHAKGKENG